MDLSKINTSSWDKVESSLKYLRDRQIIIYDSKLCNEWISLKSFANQLSNEDKKLNTNELFIKYFRECSSKELYAQLQIIAQFFFCIPGHNANVERVFSLVNSQWTKERNKLSPNTVSAIILTKYNFHNYNCSSFYGRCCITL